MGRSVSWIEARPRRYEDNAQSIAMDWYTGRQHMLFHELHVRASGFAAASCYIAIRNYKALLRSCAFRVSALNIATIRLSGSCGHKAERAK
jgi:hypothetical protein